jgi:Homeodomain-like domain/DDE superfamily endonuclease
VGGSTVFRTKRRFVRGNLEAALCEEPRPGADRKLSGKEEAPLVATACSSPPKGRARWSLELLADEMVRLSEHDNVSRETVCGGAWRKTSSSPGARTCRAFRRSTASSSPAWRMCSTSTLKSKIQDPKRPVVCFDESPTQLIGEVRQPIKAEPGQLERYDCEYKRNGTANLFIFLDVHRPWRKVKVTDSRTTIDFAACITRRRLLSQSGARPRRAG